MNLTILYGMTFELTYMLSNGGYIIITGSHLGMKIAAIEHTRLMLVLEIGSHIIMILV